jgi:hypothetical protein
LVIDVMKAFRQYLCTTHNIKPPNFTPSCSHTLPPVRQFMLQNMAKLL